LKSNILLFVFVLFIVSFIITLNVFFQQSYQSEMAEQANIQQLLVAKSTAKNIESEMQHIEAESLSLARLLAYGRFEGKGLREAVYTAYVEMNDDTDVNIKILNCAGRVRYSSLGGQADKRDIELFNKAKKLVPGQVQYIDLLASERKTILITPVKDSPGLNGVLIVEMMIEGINKKYLAPIRAGIRGHAWMMDGNGILLYHPTQQGMVGKNLNKAEEMCFGCHKSFDVEKKILSSGDIGFSSYIAPYGEDKLIAFSRAKVAQMSWIVCVSIPYSEVTFSIRKSIKLHSLLVISIFIATLTGAFSLVMINRRRIKAEEKAKHLEMQEHLEKEIIQTKDYLENILESTESKIMVLDSDMMIRTVNSAHERLCGERKEDVIGKSFFEVFPVAGDKDMNMIKEIMKKCLEGSSRRISNYPYPTAEGILYLNISINPLILHGKVSGIIISSSNVTEEVNLREELRNYAAKLEETVQERTDKFLREKEKLNVIVETIEAGLFIVEDSGEIAWINRTLRNWLGEDLSGRIKLEKIYSGEEIRRSIIERKVTQEVISQELGMRKGYFQITSTPLVGSDGNVRALVLIQDITEMKRMEEQMMHSEKLSALARISAGVAHEIGNPLTSISSYIQILREMDFDEFTKESLDTIAKHIKRITDIVRQMSGFSRTAIADLKNHNLHELVDLTLELVKYDKRMKNISVNVSVPGSLPMVSGDETQLIQVFMNIILNAADAMPDRGTLDISAAQTNGMAEISFSDSGTGIPEDNLKKIFDPFFTTKEKGTGLGLAVSYSIIKSFQGDITAENRPEGGTIFKVRLPYNET
jgi:PAS domain S-box-containing protein